jgi:hypothetical protein
MVPAVALLALIQATSSLRLFAGMVLRVMIHCGVVAISAIGAKSLSRS